MRRMMIREIPKRSKIAPGRDAVKAPHQDFSRDEDISLSYGFGRAAIWGICPLFDIVNGFLKSMPWQYRSFSQESVQYCY